MSDNKKFVPFVSSETNMAEFTIRALVIGLVLAVVLGAANAYLGLKAGMTIAATYPAAVIGMALLKAMKGSILEENFARTVGSIGESVAAGAIFTLPAFYVAGIWNPFFSWANYFTASVILIAGGVLGIMFVALLRRVMVEDADLPFPESKAAAEIHKAGRSGAGGAKFLFTAMAGGALVKALSTFKVFPELWIQFVSFTKTTIGLGSVGNAAATGGILLKSPAVSPAYMGVGYIIGPRLAALNFSGGVLAWGLLVPIILYFIGPFIDIQAIASSLIAEAAKHNEVLSQSDAISGAWTNSAIMVWKFIVRPIAIGGMLVGASFTLFKMRKSLAAGISRSISDVKKAASETGHVTERTEKDINFKWIMIGILGVAIATFLITFFLFKTSFIVAFVAATILIVLAFFFGAVSGYLVGIMGSSNNPISGLTLTALVVTALVMVLLGVKAENGGVAAVLGVAAIVCVSAAVAGEMLQDLKAGHILGGTPWRMQIGDIIGVLASGIVMFGVLVILNEGDLKSGGTGFGGANLPAPQASLMAMLSKGIVGGQMAWPLIIVGMIMGAAFILMQIKSPMLISVGMYLPLETTFAIFVGGIIKGIVDWFSERNKYNKHQLMRVENTGVLIASGFIAGEALIGLLFAGLAFFDVKLFEVFKHPTFAVSIVVLAILGYVLVKYPINNPGSTEPDVKDEIN